MPSILFVCTANQFRSPIAAACLSKWIEQDGAGGNWIVESAGTWARERLPAPALTLQTASRLGLDRLGRHLSRPISQDLLMAFDLIIVMELGHKEAIRSEFPAVRQRVYMLSEIVDGFAYDIPDPVTSNVSANTVGDEIYALIANGKEKILQLAETLYQSKSSAHGSP